MAQLPQNIKAVLQQVGEQSVLLWLYIKTTKIPGWRVYRSYSEHSCDGVLRRVYGTPKPGYLKELRIEMKARQKLVTDDKSTHFTFTLTKAEYDSCHFLAGLWFERSDYFIIPKRALRATSKAKKSYQFVVNVLKSGDYNDDSKKYLNRWDRLLNLMK